MRLLTKFLAAIICCCVVAQAQAIEIRAVRLQAPATNITQDYTIASNGAAQAVIIISGVAGSAADVNEIQMSFGFWDTANTVCWNTAYGHGITPTTTEHARNDQDASDIVQIIDPNADATLRTAVISAVTDGIRLTWLGSDLTVRPWNIVLLINGINGAQAGAVTPSGSDAGTAQETTTGLTPKVIFGGQNRRNLIDSSLAWKATSFGFAYDNGASIDQYAQHWDGISTLSSVEHYLGNARISAEGGVPDSTQEITAMVSGSFTTTSRGTGANANDLYYLVLDFDEDAVLFESTVPTTDVAWTPLTGGAFTPGSTIMMSTFRTTINSRETDENGGYFGLYFASADEEFGMGFADEDTADPTNVSGRTDTKLFIQNDTAGTPDFTATSPSFTSGQIQYSAANSGEAGSAWKVLGIAFEAVSSQSVVPILDSQRRRRAQ